MAPSLCSILALALTLLVVLQEGFGLPLSGEPEASAQSTLPRVRAKRCSCNNWLDKECIYFCHLDIIWVNTPSKITPYGLGSPLSRRRRSTDRCECAHPGDNTCSGFCHNSSDNPSILVVGPLEQTNGRSDTNSYDLLASLRNVVRSNMMAAKQASPSRKKPSRANKHKIK